MNIVCRYMQWRYGGCVYALKPPLGYDRRKPQPLLRVAAYRIKRIVWRIENAAFQRWCGEMRKRWEESMQP